MAGSNIGDTLEYDDAVLEVAKWSKCEDCHFMGTGLCHSIPCSKNERMDEEDVMFLEVKR